MATSGQVSLFMFSGNWVTEKETTSYAPNWRNWVYSWWKCKTQRNPARVVRFKSKVEQPLIMMLYQTTQLSLTQWNTLLQLFGLCNFLQFTCLVDLIIFYIKLLSCCFGTYWEEAAIFTVLILESIKFIKKKKRLIMKMELLDIII